MLKDYKVVSMSSDRNNHWKRDTPYNKQIWVGIQFKSVNDDEKQK